MMLLCIIMGVKCTIYPDMYYYIANYNFTASKWLAFISWWFFMLVTFCLIKIVDLLKERKKKDSCHPIMRCTMQSLECVTILCFNLLCLRTTCLWHSAFLFAVWKKNVHLHRIHYTRRRKGTYSHSTYIFFPFVCLN